MPLRKTHVLCGLWPKMKMQRGLRPTRKTQVLLGEWPAMRPHRAQDRGPAADDRVQSDVVTESRPHSSKPSDLCALSRLSIARIVEEDATIPRGGRAPAPSPVVDSKARRPSVAPTLPLQIPVLSNTEIQIASQNTKLALFLTLV